MKNLISEFLQTRIDANDFPSAVYLVAEKGKIVASDALGFAVVEPERIAARLDTIYDLASLTKPLITGLLCAKLIENGSIALTDRVGKYFPRFDNEEKRSITIQNLLTHTSGLEAWKPFYLLIDSPSGLLDCIAQLPLKNPVNSTVVYSDLNFLILKFLIEKLYSKTIDEVANEQIFTPLQLRKTFYNPAKEFRGQIAASEKGNEYEKKTCSDSGYDTTRFGFRDYPIWGEVHDGNCFFLNGVSSHAGLFSNAEETLQIAQQFLADETTVLKPETCQLFRTNFTPDLNEARSISFQLAETPESTAGSALAGNSFGHLGFTGTSVWIEPETARIFILLTNRTHAHTLPFVNINSSRRTFHELAVKILDAPSA